MHKLLFIVAALGVGGYWISMEFKNKLPNLAQVEAKPKHKAEASSVASTKQNIERGRSPSSLNAPSEDDYVITKGKGTDIYARLTLEERKAVIATLEVEIERDSQYLEYLIARQNPDGEKVLEIPPTTADTLDISTSDKIIAAAKAALARDNELQEEKVYHQANPYEIEYLAQKLEEKKNILDELKSGVEQN